MADLLPPSVVQGLQEAEPEEFVAPIIFPELTSGLLPREKADDIFAILEILKLSPFRRDDCTNLKVSRNSYVAVDSRGQDAEGLIQVLVQMNTQGESGSLNIANDLWRMMASVHTYWYCDKKGEPKGTYHGLVDFVKLRRPQLEVYLETISSWPWSRVHGNFFILLQRSDGTIVVSEDFERVYLVQGIYSKLLNKGEQAPFKATFTLVPFDRYIVCSDMVISKTDWNVITPAPNMNFEPLISIPVKTHLAKVYEDAVATSSLITSLDTRRPDDFTEDLKYQVDEDAPAPRYEFSERQLAFRARVAASPKLGGRAGEWLMWETGLNTDADPTRTITFSNQAGQELGVGQPIPDMDLDAMVKALHWMFFREDINGGDEEGKEEGGGGVPRVPKVLNLAFFGVFKAVRQLLKGTGTEVRYSPPLSPEERTYYTYRPHLIIEQMFVRSFLYAGDQGGCVVCHASGGGKGGGLKLKKCTRCAAGKAPAVYCSREHQRHHWDAGHKKVCATPKKDADTARMQVQPIFVAHPQAPPKNSPIFEDIMGFTFLVTCGPCPCCNKGCSGR